MSNIIRLGICNKKLFIPLGVAFVQILINVMNIIIPEDSKNQILEIFGVIFSEMALASILKVASNRYKKDNTSIFQKRSKRRIFCHFLILFLVFGTMVSLNIFKSLEMIRFYQQNKSFINIHNSGLSSFESLELIFICIVSFVLLKYKYFIHHNISIVIFVLSSFFIDLIIGKFTDIFEIGVRFVILSVIIIILDAIGYGYQKYLIEVKFYPYWSLPVILGLTNFVIFGTILVLCLIKGKEESFKEKNMIFISFYNYFDVVEVKIIIIKQVLNFILNLALNMFRILLIIYFTPDFILISFTISRILDIILDTHKYICLALFFLQFITLMFYLEIFEFNFCGLNKNTRRNIQERERLEMLLQDSSTRDDSRVLSISPDYFISKDVNFNNNDNDNDNDNNASIRSKNKIFELWENVIE